MSKVVDVKEWQRDHKRGGDQQYLEYHVEAGRPGERFECGCEFEGPHEARPEEMRTGYTGPPVIVAGYKRCKLHAGGLPMMRAVKGRRFTDPKCWCGVQVSQDGLRATFWRCLEKDIVPVVGV